jgi:hypothetical protein
MAAAAAIGFMISVMNPAVGSGSGSRSGSGSESRSGSGARRRRVATTVAIGVFTERVSVTMAR